MTTIALTDCCTMLGIDPKTLRTWLKHSNMSLATHPTDARLKCLTQEQVQQLAILHARPLSSPPSLVTALPEEAGTLAPTADLLPACVSEERNLRMSVASLEKSVATLQEQLAQLALELFHEQGRSVELRLSALEGLIHPTTGPCPASYIREETSMIALPSVSLRPERHLLPVELQARCRVIPLIEYGAQDLSVAVCPQEGVLPFASDSSPWFDWLASLTSFRFVGQQGRFTAYREAKRGVPTRGWIAHRGIHGRHYKHWLGVTDRLTIDCLEQMAAHLQSRLTAL